MKYDLDSSNNMHHGAPPSSFSKAKSLRENETVAEKILWGKLKNKQLSGYKFRRQHPIAAYILDFYCYKQKLAIEVDGEYHFTPEQQKLDKERTLYFTENDIKIIRFTNEQVINNTEWVLNKIIQEIEK